MIEITGAVLQKERSQMMRPGVVKPDLKEFLHIPVFRLRIIDDTGRLVQVLYKGEPPGDAEMGDHVMIKGMARGGVIYARSIYNSTTSSWVTPAPGFLDKLFGGRF